MISVLFVPQPRLTESIHQSVNRNRPVHRPPKHNYVPLKLLRTISFFFHQLKSKSFFQLFKAENIDLNVYSHFQKQNNKEQLWYNLKNLKNVNSVSINNKQTNKKSCKFDYGNIFILFIILSFQREAATEKLITPLG